MDLVRTMAWAALLVGSGVPSSQPPAPGLPATAPAESPKPAPTAPERSQPASTWPLELDDDEFEGEGWSFWPLSTRRD